MRKFVSLFFALALVFCVFPATLEWDRNPESSVTGYRVYIGRNPRTYDSIFDAGNNVVFSISKPATGTTNFYAVTAYNDEGLESELSEEVSWGVTNVIQTTNIINPLLPTIPENLQIDSVTIIK